MSPRFNKVSRRGTLCKICNKLRKGRYCKICGDSLEEEGTNPEATYETIVDYISGKQLWSNFKSIPGFSDSICVRFLIVQPKQVESLYVGFESEQLGGWDNSSVQMQLTEEVSQGYIYQADLRVPVIMLKTPLEYKYGIIDKGKVIWEYLHYVYRSSKKNSRLLVISKSFLDVFASNQNFTLQTGLIWYQVDDFFMVPNEKDIPHFSFHGIFKHAKVFFTNSGNVQHSQFIIVFNIYLQLLLNTSFYDQMLQKGMFVRGLYFGFFESFYSNHKGIYRLWHKVAKDEELIKHLFDVLEVRLKENIKNTIDGIISCLPLLIFFYENDTMIEKVPFSFTCAIFKRFSLEHFDNYNELSTKIKSIFSKKYLRMIQEVLSLLLQAWLKKYYSNSVWICKAHYWCYGLVLIKFVSQEKDFFQKFYLMFLKKNENIIPYKETLTRLTKVQGCLKSSFMLQRLLAHHMTVNNLEDALKSGLFDQGILIRMLTYHLESQQYNNKMGFWYQDFLSTVLANYQLDEYNRQQLADSLFDMLLISLNIIPITNDSCAFFSKVFAMIKELCSSISKLDDEEILWKLQKIKLLLKKGFCKLDCKWHEFSSLVSQLKILNDLLNFEINSVKELEDCIVDILTTKAQQMDTELLLKVYCDLDMVSYEEEVKLVFHDIVSSLVEQYVMTEFTINYQQSMSHTSSSYWVKSLVQVMKIKYESLKNEEEQMNFCLTWKPLSAVLKIKEIINNPSKDTTIEKILSMLRYISETIINGEISLKKFLSMLENQSFFEAALSCNADFEDSFIVRVKQAHLFKRVQEVASFTMKICRQLFSETVEITMIEETINKDFSNTCLKEIFGGKVYNLALNQIDCRKLQPFLVTDSEFSRFYITLPSLSFKYERCLIEDLKVGTIDDNEMYTVEISVKESKENDQTDGNDRFLFAPTNRSKQEEKYLLKACRFFKISSHWFNYASRMMDFNIVNSVMFLKELDLTLKSQYLKSLRLPLNFIDLIKSIILPTILKLKLTLEDILVGKINLRKAEIIFSDGRDQQCINQELKLLFQFLNTTFDNDNSLESCIQKVNYALLVHNYFIARKVMKLKNELNLTGDFECVEAILKLFKESENLEKTSANFNDFKKYFEDFSPEICEIVKTASMCSELVSWLKESLKDPKEVKVFVDMMSIAAGETDYEVDRVKCFEASCVALTPFIFELKSNSSFVQLLEACKKTRTLIKNDPEIIKKMIDSNHNLLWFKNAKKSQGSVTSKSIMEAQAANRYGVFVVGNESKINDYFVQTTLADIIKLKVGHNNLIKEYSYEEVKDLQNRLMLLGSSINNKTSSEKQEEKDYFVEVVEVITRLAHAYLMLWEAGDIRFKDWKRNFSCKFESKKDERISDLKLECENFENKLAEWKDELINIRNRSPLVNHFTVKQSLFLLEKLFLLKNDNNNWKSLPTQFYTLLRSFSNKISLTEINEAITYSHSFGKNNEKKQEWKTAESSSNFDKYTSAEIEKFVDDLQEKYDIMESLAWAAIVKCFPFKQANAVAWCNEQDLQNDEVYEWESEARKKHKQVQYSEDFQTPQHKSTVEGTAFSSLTDLGKFLEEYTVLVGFKHSHRIKPKYTNEDKPSLFIVSQDDVIYVVLEMYLHCNGSLPSSEEVLLCDDSVSSEEIELLILRASQNADGLYCLVLYDRSMQYETYAKTFSFLQRMMKSRNMSTLVIVCSIEHQNNSYLVTALNHCKLKMPHSINKDVIHEKIAINLQQKLEDKNAGIKFNELIYKVLVVKSNESGMGKSLFVKTCGAHLSTHLNNCYSKSILQSKNKNHVITIPVHGTTVNVNSIVEALMEFDEMPDARFPRLYHFDINPMLRDGLDLFLFNIIILGTLKTNNGKVWRLDHNDTCIIEITNKEIGVESVKDYRKQSLKSFGVMIDMLPFVLCFSPYDLKSGNNQDFPNNGWSNYEEYKKPTIQRVSYYLNLYDKLLPNNQKSTDSFNNFVYKDSCKTMKFNNCLDILLKYCGVDRPSWSELRNFTHFFNSQLMDYERCSFTSVLCVNDLRGFKMFVVKFLLEMAQDFSTCSLSTETYKGGNQYMIQLKRQWEHSLHPYIFFNQDHETMTFFGFNVDQFGNLIDTEKKIIIKKGFMPKDLYDDISRQMHGYGSLNMNYNELDRKQKLEILCQIMGINVFDPDPSYELSVDNMKKILAIHMRLRCNIPVIMMGETGCGKTKLIKFMCALQAGRSKAKNMLLVKVHGGVTHKDILARTEQAKICALANYTKYHVRSVLFFDEANTSEAIGLIKEIMVDKRADGKPLGLEECGLEIIAACNPYKKHSSEMIKKLESAGLGYHVKSDYEKIGDIPLRQLVYRVHPLPKSMIPFVWDFGQLNAETEKLYARLIVLRYVKEKKIPNKDSFFDLIVMVLNASQAYMRQQKDECSFVSLRDLERSLLAIEWFYDKMDVLQEKILTENQKMQLTLIYTLSVCYIAKLEDRDSYRKYISQYFTGSFSLKRGWMQMKEEVISLQKNFLKGVELEDNIALNEALCENVFMMVVCIELCIPLFIIGKPGSSKSLAKSIVQDNMQGTLSKSELFRNFKQIFMSSYQCSPLSTAEGIINTFKQSSRFQEGKDLKTFTSVVVLDEIGLAEDSQQMPLKALHPLLEDGTDGSEHLTFDGSLHKDKKVGFIGISNWSLDPAKMNRGIMLYRGQLELSQLVETAREICSSDELVQDKIKSLFEPLAKGYLEVYDKQKKMNALTKFKKEEFFGLRDFYSLIKLLFCYTRKLQSVPTVIDIENAVRRNFSGLQDFDAWKVFKSNLPKAIASVESPASNISVLKMIADSLENHCPCSINSQSKKDCKSSRYLLLMTENYSALPMVEHLLCTKDNDIPESCIFFGSSFPKDQQFTQVCRDINRIKMCMETGTTIVLLNMENLYESLYDTLNQYYVSLGGKNYVDLGLGTHRVKCRVHEKFRIIVIAEKTVVYKTFPVPLINRLEKHFLTISNTMQVHEEEIVKNLQKWAVEFACVKSSKHKFKLAEVFIGYTEDTCASIILKLSKKFDDPKKIFEEGCKLLLRLATPDSLLRVNLTSLKKDFEYLWDIYFNEQFHQSLLEYLQVELTNEDSKFLQITTFSRLLSPLHKENFVQVLKNFKVEIISLVQFQTEHSFREFIRVLCSAKSNKRTLLIIQVNNAQERSNLIACAQYICKEECRQYKISVVFILQLNYKAKNLHLLGSFSFCECYHIDELWNSNVASLIKYSGKSLDEIFLHFIDDKNAQHGITQLVVGSVKMSIRHLSERKKMSADEVSEKISILTQLLRSDPKETNYLFVTTIIKLIQDAFKVEQSKMLPYHVTNWIQQEAVEQKYLPAYGSFQQALCCYVEDHTVPLLSSIIGGIDIFDNLMIYQNKEYTDLWLKLFANASISYFSTQSELNTSSHTSFQCKFPFSYWLFKELDGSIKKDIQPDEYDIIYNIISSKPMGKLVLKLTSFQLEDYIFDLVHYLFPNESQSCYMMLVFAVDFFSRKYMVSIRKCSEVDDIEYDIVSIHVILNTKAIKERIENIASVLRNHAEEKFYIPKSEVDVDVMVLEQLLSTLGSNRLLPIGIEKVRKARPLVNNIIGSALKMKCGNLTIKKINELRTQWCKLRIYERFADFVFHPSTCFCFHQIKLLTSLWKALSLLPNDMLLEDSWNILEEFLNQAFVMDYNDLKADCLVCDDSKLSFNLPCCQAISKKCIHHILLERKNCANCGTFFKKEYIFQESFERRHMVFERNEFKKRCIVFYAEIVTEFYFMRNDVDRVNKDILEKIINYVFLHDNTRVIQSFLIQHLIQRSNNEDENYLQKYFDRQFKFAEKYHLDFATLLIYCFENKLQSRYSILKRNTAIEADFLNHVSDELEKLSYFIEEFQSVASVTSLKNIASIRLYLAYSAEILYARFFCKEGIAEGHSRILKNIFASLRQFVLKYKGSPSHVYLLKQIVRNYGMDCLKKIALEPEVNWLFVKEESRKVKSYDKFLLYGNNYKNTISCLVTSVLEEDFTKLSHLEQDTKRRNLLSMLQLAIVKGISNLPEKVVTKVQHRLNIQKCLFTMKKFSVVERYSDVLYHFWVVVTCGKPAINFYTLLMTNPSQVNGWFFPAMPSDNFLEVFGVRQTDKNSAFVFYTCPKGHPYVITECGRPNQVYICPDCGLSIGGQNHVLINGNKTVYNSYDNTRSGHCLGSPSERSSFAIPQRNLTPASTTLQNLLVDLSLLVAVLMGHEKDVSKLVYPHTEPNEIQEFLLQHLEKDFSLLSNTIAKNDDETNTAVHLLLKRLLESNKQEYQHLELKDQTSRKTFENAFDRTVVQPFFSSLDEELTLFNKHLLMDPCINDSPLMREIYELDDEQVNERSSVTVMSPQLWFYRQSVSFESLKNAIQLRVASGDAKDISILATFLEQETVLSMIKDLPSIIELQKFLQHEFNYKLDKQTAADKSVKQILSELRREVKNAAHKLFGSFIKSWNQARSHFTEKQINLQPNLPSVKLDLNSKLAYFISSNSNDGLCATVLIDFLSRKQNELLEECKMVNSSQVIQRIPLLQLKETDVISYERKRDLLPLALLHCDYFIGAVRSQKMKFNLEVIQKRLFENVIYGKAFIHVESFKFFYRDDVKSLNFPLLRRSVKQTVIPFLEQQKMLDEILDIADVSFTLRAVEIAIGILASTGGDPNMLLRKYLTDILRMNERECLASGKMHDCIRLTHMYSLWLMLTVERARRILSGNQIPFQINESFMSEELEIEVREEQEKLFLHVDTKELIYLVTEYIVLELPLRNQSATTMSLVDALQIYEDQQGSQIIHDVNKIHEAFQLKHIYLLWKILMNDTYL